MIISTSVDRMRPFSNQSLRGPGIQCGNPITFLWPLIAFLATVLLSGCDIFSSAMDERAPRVTIVQPGSDAVVSGEHVLLVIESEALGDDNWTSFVNVTVNGEKMGEAIPVGDRFQYRLNTTDFEDGVYRIEAVAFDRFQARGTSAPLIFTVRNHSASPGPLFDIIAPSDNEQVLGTVRIVARAQPAQAFPTSVELLVDGIPVMASETSSGNDTYLFDWDSSDFVAGDHFVQVIAFSDVDVFSISDPIVVSVVPVDDENELRKPGTIAWRTTGYNGEVRGSVAVGFNNDIYVGSTSDTLYAFAGDGRLKWKYATRGPIRSAPIVGNNEDVFVTSEDGRLYGFDSDGHPLWTAYNTGAALRSSPTLGVEGAVYFGDTDGRVHAVSSFNGQPITGNWPANVSLEAIVAPPVLSQDRTLFIAAGDGHIYALAPDGSTLWQSIDMVGNVVIGMALVEMVDPLIDPDSLSAIPPADAMINVIYAVSSDGYIHAISGEDGLEFWKEILPGPVRSAPVVGSDGTIYVGTSTGLVAFNETEDAFTPRLRFVFPADDVGVPAIDSNEVIHFVSRTEVHAINPNNTPYWRYDTGAESDAPLTLTRHGLLIVAGQNGVLTALETGSVGLALEKWPMFQRNARHTGRLGLDARD